MGDLGPMSHALDAEVALAQSQARRLPPADALKTADPRVARRKAEEFEAVFLAQMISHMWTDVPTDGRFRGGFAENIWRQHMFQAMGDELARSGGVGLAEQVHAQILMGAGGHPPEEALRIAAEAARGHIRGHARVNAEKVDNTGAVTIATGRLDGARLHPAMLDAQAARDATPPPPQTLGAYRAPQDRGDE